MAGPVTVVFLGGTISMTPTATGGVAPTLRGDELLAGVPTDLAVETVDLMAVDSSHLRFADLLAAARVAEQAVQAGSLGVVVVQGTDTMEETAYLLDLVWGHDVPLVVAGAMRHATQPGADGSANLAAALAVASCPEAVGLGVVVVLGDEVHAARAVTKSHASLPNAFVSPDSGPLGRLLEGRPVLPWRLRRRPALPLPSQITARVGLHWAVLDDDPDLFRAQAELCDGLVVAGYGAGHLREPVADAAAAAAGRIPVVLTTRTGTGSVHTRTYSGPGSEQDLLARGLINAGHLQPLKARVLLALLLSLGARPEESHAEEIRAAFALHGSG